MLLFSCSGQVIKSEVSSASDLQIREYSKCIYTHAYSSTYILYTANSCVVVVVSNVAFICLQYYELLVAQPIDTDARSEEETNTYT